MRDNNEKVVRAFWRRIWMYKDDHEKELPEKLPIEFRCSIDTAMLAHSEIEELKAEVKLLQGVANDDQKEIDMLRELLFSIGKYACGEDQLDVFSDTEALLELAKLVGHYEDPPRYSPEALNR